jgi:hypothetical protein
MGEATCFAPSFALAFRLERVEFTRVEAHDLLMVGAHPPGSSLSPGRDAVASSRSAMLPPLRWPPPLN